MRNLISFSPVRLTNAAHGQYVANLIQALEGFTTENQLFKNQLAALKSVYKVEEEAFILSTRSDQTSVLWVADAEQDNGVNGLKALLTAAAYDPEKQEHAALLQNVIRPYRLDAREQVAQEAYKVAQCVEALEAEPAQQAVTAIGATPFVTQMKQGAAAVVAALQARNDERAKLTPEAMANARIGVDNALREMLFVADAFHTLMGDEASGELMAKLNANTQYAKDHMLTRSKQEEKPAEGQPADPKPGTGGKPEAKPDTDGGGVVTPVQPAP